MRQDLERGDSENEDEDNNSTTRQKNGRRNRRNRNHRANNIHESLDKEILGRPIDHDEDEEDEDEDEDDGNQAGYKDRLLHRKISSNTEGFNFD